jgi:hypothetical protein
MSGLMLLVLAFACLLAGRTTYTLAMKAQPGHTVAGFRLYVASAGFYVAAIGLTVAGVVLALL